VWEPDSELKLDGGQEPGSGQELGSDSQAYTAESGRPRRAFKLLVAYISSQKREHKDDNVYRSNLLHLQMIHFQKDGNA
jgi:hypothetical protein